jgi:epoxide hydrolase-like predicted phosphatase
MIKAIIFDYVGVVVRQFSPKFFEYISKLKNLDQEEVKLIFKKHWMPVKIGKISYDVFWQGMAKDLELTTEEVEDTKQFILNLFEPSKKTLDVIRELGKKFKLYLLSNSCEWSEESYKFHGVNSLFEKEFFSHKVGLAKPDIKIYELAIKDIGLKPEEIIFIDDKLDNVTAANNAGLNGILFENIEDLIEKKLINYI